MRILVLSAVLFVVLLNAACGASGAAVPTPGPSPTAAVPAATALPPLASAAPTATLPVATPSSSAPGSGNATPLSGGNSTPRAGITLAPRQPTATPQATGELNVTFERYGGFTGRNQSYHLKPDGSVDDGKVVLHAAGGAAAAAALAAQIAATGIYTVKPGSYIGANTCCDRVEYDVTLVQNGQSYKFVTLDNEPLAPPALVEVIGLIAQYVDAAS